MDLNDYEKEMLRTAKKVVPYSFFDFKCGNTSEEAKSTQSALCNALFGLIGESGELTDLIKKWQFHNHELDVTKVISELGDIHWYWSYLCYIFGVAPNEVLECNVEKLRKRYPNGFTSEDSVARRDVNE